MTTAGERALAKAKGEKFYFTGKPCCRGHLARRRTYNGKCTECIFPSSSKHAEYSAAWRKRHPGREVIVKYRHRYGVELTEIRPKPDRCEICGTAHKKIVFDHCHTTNKFRGWLCDPCNMALGAVKDDVAVLARMIAYLRGELVQGHTAENNGLEKGHVRQS